MAKLKVLVALITEENDYQREQASVAEATARRLGFDLQVIYANSDAIAQTRQILAAIQPSTTDRPDAVIVEPVGTGMAQVARVASNGNIAWIVLNRGKECLIPQAERSAAPSGCIDTDNLEVGRMQGRQLAALLPNGGKVLYIEGPSAEVSKRRRTGLDATLPANIEIKLARGKWTEESGYQAIASLLKIQGSRPPNVDVIGSQNDAMAMGARRAVETLTAPEHRDLWLKLPLIGCDGVPATGQAWVQQKLLTATIVTPALTGVALEMLAKAIESRAPMPECTLTSPLSLPRIEELRPAATHAQAPAAR